MARHEYPPHGTRQFLHNPDSGKNYEGAMIRSRLHRMEEMASELLSMINPEDEIPAWVQDHIAVAHSKLASVFSYLEPRASGV
jgi:hypothetical protein